MFPKYCKNTKMKYFFGIFEIFSCNSLIIILALKATITGDLNFIFRFENH